MYCFLWHQASLIIDLITSIQHILSLVNPFEATRVHWIGSTTIRNTTQLEGKPFSKTTKLTTIGLLQQLFYWKTARTRKGTLLLIKIALICFSMEGRKEEKDNKKPQVSIVSCPPVAPPPQSTSPNGNQDRPLRIAVHTKLRTRPGPIPP